MAAGFHMGGHRGVERSPTRESRATPSTAGHLACRDPLPVLRHQRPGCATAYLGESDALCGRTYGIEAHEVVRRHERAWTGYRAQHDLDLVGRRVADHGTEHNHLERHQGDGLVALRRATSKSH